MVTLEQSLKKERAVFYFRMLSLVFILLSTVSCSKQYIQKILEDNPDILVSVIKKHPKKVLNALNEASLEYRKKQAEEAQKSQATKREDEFKNPKKPVLGEKRAYFGDKNAPITVVEYSDFRCGYCKRAHEGAVMQILKEYDGKVRVLYKHFPVLSPQSRKAAQYYEAITQLDASKSKMFHDKIFERQGDLQSDKFLDELVKEVGLSVTKVKSKLDDAEAVVKADEEEARKFGVSGTPSFLVGGISLSGAQPFSEFKSIIDRLIKDMEK